MSDDYRYPTPTGVENWTNNPDHQASAQQFAQLQVLRYDEPQQANWYNNKAIPSMTVAQIPNQKPLTLPGANSNWYNNKAIPSMTVAQIPNQKPLTLPAPGPNFPLSLSTNEWSEIYGSAMETKGGATSSSVNRMHHLSHINDEISLRSPMVGKQNSIWEITPTNSGWGASPKSYWAATPTNSPWGVSNYDYSMYSDYPQWNCRPSPSPMSFQTSQSPNAAAKRLGLVGMDASLSGNLTLQSYRPGQTSIPLSRSGSINGENRLSTPLTTFAEKGKRGGKNEPKGKGQKIDSPKGKQNKVKKVDNGKKNSMDNGADKENASSNNQSPVMNNGAAPSKELVTKFETAIYRCAKERNWQRAVKKLRDMQTETGQAPTVRAYTSAISACSKVGQSATARYLLTEMKKFGVQPNVLTYSAVISACEKGRKCRQAMQLLEEMRENGVEPDVITYNAVISACEKARKWKLAIDVLDDMKKRNVKPDVITYSAAISACEKGAKLDHALELLQNLKNDGLKPDVILYNAVISACDKRGDWQKVGLILTEMESVGVKPDVISYSTAISACDRGKNLEFALQILARMKQENMVPNNIAFTALVRAAERDGQLELAKSMKVEMKSHGLTPLLPKGKQYQQNE